MKKIIIITVLIVILITGGYLFSKTSTFKNYTNNISNFLKLKKENDYLKEKMSNETSLKANITEFNIENKELKMLKERLNKESQKYITDVAIVTKRDFDTWNSFVEINKGSKNGVKINTNVMTSQGLVGKVIEVSENSSKVELLSAVKYNSYISVQPKNNHQLQGLIKGADEKTGYLKMTLFNVNDKLKAGEIIVTSGLGGIYLTGIEIGKVKEVKIDNLGLNQTAYIEPLYDLNDLEYVILLLSKK
ncbi:rod shape-determining protein MreC [Bacillus sp. AFS088145]|uniref:rod shape-determining protein MreC n=1 Tax=Bacillus sp. AFS088145 TaxID=2033514 RepID=UPI000BF35504|nr:rod shape-determining protein MreC [Bacillus sp. AFS088145]PFH90616.1 rod shape-determining protein MreC [Bacillus sp. AFS088145]